MSLDLELNLDQINVSVANGRKDLVYEFGDFRLESEHLMLYRHGLEIPLTPKQVETLLALVERSGEIVSKEVLMAQLWGNSVVEESNLIQNIHFLRKVLGDSSNGRPFIETLRRRGYRFNAEVRRLRKSDHRIGGGNGNPSLSSESRAAFDERKTAAENFDSAQTGRRFALGGILAFVSIALLSAVLLLSWKPATATAKIKFAILPFTAIDQTNRSIHFDQGIADSLINRLSSVRGFIIRPLSSVRSYADAPIDPVSAGREQEVDYVLASNYQIADRKVKIRAQLYQVATGNVEETFQSEQDVTNVFGAQDAIAAEFSNKLMARFRTSRSGPVKGRGTDNEEAYSLYQHAMNLIAHRRRAANSVKAREYLEKAVALDPNYADAWSGIALAVRSSGRTDSEQIHREMIEAINKALAIDPNASEAYSALCLDTIHFGYDHVGAETACKQAIELDPASSEAHRAYSWVLRFSGRYDEALAEIRTAIDLDPVSYLIQRDYGHALYGAGRMDEAAAHWKRLIDLDPADAVPYYQLIRIFQRQGQEAEAFECFIKVLALRQADPETVQRYRDIYHTSGWRGVMIERAQTRLYAPGGGTDFGVATLYALAGEKDKAFEHLERSFQQREWNFADFRESPELESLRDDPRYDVLVSRVTGN